MSEALIPKRVEILRFLAKRERDREVPPTVREICAAVGLGSTQTVHHHLLRLSDGGYVEGGEGRKRSARLTGRGWQAVGEAPMLGRIAAGRGLEAIAEAETYSIASEILAARGGKARFLLRVVGDSMLGAHIADGDTVVVEEDEDPPEGSVVVALIGGGEEVTVKRLFREGERVRLKAENEAHEDIVLGAEDVELQGRVVHVIHPPRRR